MGVTALEGPSSARLNPERRGLCLVSQQGPRSSSSLLLVLESWSQLGKSSQATRQEAAQPQGCACRWGTSSHSGCFLAQLVAGHGGWWLCSHEGQRISSSQAQLGFGQTIRMGRRASCRHEPFPGSPLDTSHCDPRAGDDPGSLRDASQGSKGSSKHGGLGNKSELCSCETSSCFPLSVQGRCFRAVWGWMKPEEQQWGHGDGFHCEAPARCSGYVGQEQGGLSSWFKPLCTGGRWRQGQSSSSGHAAVRAELGVPVEQVLAAEPAPGCAFGDHVRLNHITVTAKFLSCFVSPHPLCEINL